MGPGPRPTTHPLPPTLARGGGVGWVVGLPTRDSRSRLTLACTLPRATSRSRQPRSGRARAWGLWVWWDPFRIVVGLYVGRLPTSHERPYSVTCPIMHEMLNRAVRVSADAAGVTRISEYSARLWVGLTPFRGRSSV